jgi:predicted nucleotidyltransferase
MNFDDVLELKKTIEIIKGEIENRGLKIVKIILFGSRARGEANEDSDWDFLIVVDKNLDRPTKQELIIKIKRNLARLKIPNDIIINSIIEFEDRKNNVGYITYYASREGKII